MKKAILTDKEIKQALSACSMRNCKICPYFVKRIDCLDRAEKDALGRIKRLEKEVSAVKGELFALKAILAHLGEKVYFPYYNDYDEILSFDIVMVGLDEKGWFVEIDDEETSRIYLDDKAVVGVEVFLTEDAARRAR